MELSETVVGFELRRMGGKQEPLQPQQLHPHPLPMQSALTLFSTIVLSVALFCFGFPTKLFFFIERRYERTPLFKNPYCLLMHLHNTLTARKTTEHWRAETCKN